MRLRFLRTTTSATPGYPFQPGQTIAVDRLTRQHRDWLANGDAVLVEEPTPDVAVTQHPETAVTESTPKRRGAR